jgi:peptide/nickel transport system ATP-binding protein
MMPDSQATGAEALRLVVADLRVVVRRSGHDVVDEVSFAIRAGEVLGLVGETGSGKTTVALALAGHARRGLSIAGGRVLLDDRDVLTLSARELRHVRGRQIAYVPQDPSSALDPTRAIGIQLAEALRVHGYSRDEATNRLKEVLAEVRLDLSRDFLRCYPHQLSGGQQQRITLAMAFACRPALIVLDEPTTGLDVTTQRHVLETIRALCRSYGVAAVYVSHDLAVVAELVSSVAIMYAGRLIEFGAVQAVFSSPAHPYSQRLLRAVPSAGRAEVLQGIEGTPPRPGNRPPGCSFAPRCPLVVPACKEEPPPAVELADGRRVRCLRAGEAELPAPGAETLSPAASRSGEACALRVEGLVAAYGSTEVLHHIDLLVPWRRCVALVGESGSGKTTLARCVVGLHTNCSGELHYGSERLAPGYRYRSENAHRGIQFVFQNPYTSLNPRRTVGQIVERPLQHFGESSRREREAKVVTALEDAALSAEFLNRYPDQLSGGERQRVAIARALVVEPELLVCDEVTAALDVSVQAAIVQLLRRLQAERGLAMLFITHNLALVRSIAQDIVVLANGVVVETGSVQTVLERPSDAYTIQLLEDVPKLGSARSDAPGPGPQPVSMTRALRAQRTPGAHQ